MTAAEDVIHNKDDRSSDDVANISKKENIGCEMEDSEDMFHKHCEDRKLRKESTRPFHKKIDGISKHLQTAPLQRMKYPVWENIGNTEGVLREEEENQAEISENDKESICTGDALGYSSKRAVDGMLNVGNQKQLRETIDEMSMIENTVGDKKFEDDKENCCLFSENFVIPGDVEVVPIQDRKMKKSLTTFTSTMITRVVNALMMVMPQCLSVPVGCHWRREKVMEKMSREML